MLLAAAARALTIVLPRLPLALLGPLSELAGTIAWLASPRARAAVGANQRIVAPGRRPRVRAAFVGQVRSYLETFRLLRLTAAEVDRNVDVPGWANLEAALVQGKGAIVASAHVGPVALAGQAILARGHEVTVPVEPGVGPLVRAVNRARAGFGGQIVEAGSGLGIHRVLRRNGILAVVADRAVTGIGERVRFFGRETLLPSAHIAIALRSGAPVVPGFAHRRKGRLVAEFEPALELRRTGDHEADVRAGVQEFARVMERHIAESPEQWAVFEPVWEA